MAFDRDKSKNRKRRKVCQFCVDKCTYIDYKDTAKLRRFLSERSKILPRRTTGITSSRSSKSISDTAHQSMFLIAYLVIWATKSCSSSFSGS